MAKKTTPAVTQDNNIPIQDKDKQLQELSQAVLNLQAILREVKAHKDGFENRCSELAIQGENKDRYIQQLEAQVKELTERLQNENQPQAA